MSGLNRIRGRALGKRQRGAAIAEIVVVLPMLLLVGLSTIQFALIYEAKASLNYATLMAARAGAVSELDKSSMQLAFARAISPLYSPKKSLDGRVLAFGQAYLDTQTHTIFQILNPTQEAFVDFAIRKPGTNFKVIPNERLHLASTDKGNRSGVNVQDANLLKLNVVYGYELKVPFAGQIITRIVSWTNPTRGYSRLRKQIMLGFDRLPIQATAIVRMQSDAKEGNSWVQKRDDVDAQLADTKKAPPSFLLPNENKRAWRSGPTGSGW